MAKKLSAVEKEAAENELIDWLVSRCPVCLPETDYRKVASRFLKGQLIVIYGPIKPDGGKVEIRVD